MKMSTLKITVTTGPKTQYAERMITKINPMTTMMIMRTRVMTITKKSLMKKMENQISVISYPMTLLA